MATLEDKLLGEKTQNYCSSSEDEGLDDDEGGAGPASLSLKSADPGAASAGNQPWQGYSQNTGPKGVLRDWQLYQEHEEQSRLDKAKQLEELAKKAMTCRPESVEKPADFDEDDLLSDDVLRDFVKKRMETMFEDRNEILYGTVQEIDSRDEYLKVIDDSNPKVTIVVHIYDQALRECATLNECLNSLSAEYKNVRFCKIRATVAGVSSFFKQEGVPALLIYKGGNLVANFVRMKEALGSEFYAGDVENFLIENGILHDQSSISSLLIEKLKVK